MKILSKSDKEILDWSFKYAKPYKKQLVLIFTNIIILILLTTIEPILRAKFISLLFLNDLSKIIKILVLLVVVYFLQLIMSFFKSFLLIKVDNNMTNNLKKDMYQNIINLPMRAFDNIDIGELMSRMNGDVQVISNIVTNYLVILLSDLITVIFIGITMIRLNFILFLVIVVTFPITWTIFRLYGKKLREQGKMLKILNDKCFAKTQQSFAGIKEITALGIKEKVVLEMNNILDDINNKTIRYAAISMKSNIIAYAVNSLDKIIFIIVATLLILDKKINVEIFIAFLSYSVTFSSSLSNLTQINSVIQQFLVSLERVFNLNNNLSYTTTKFGNKHIAIVSGNIRFENVSFSYLNAQKNIKDIDIEINKFSKVAIVGKSGSGKSTIFNLLLRFYDNYDGKICIDGVDIRDLTEETIRKNIATVMQSNYLFNLSIKENLTITNPEATAEQVIDICKKCNIHEYIMKLPEGYDTHVTEGGGNFSCGQKQKIAIARALLQNAKIILFDEVTSSLDNESQLAITELIDYVSKEHTVVVIAHRLNTIKYCKKIIVIDNGEIKAVGSHKELLNTSNVYKELFLKGEY